MAYEHIVYPMRAAVREAIMLSGEYQGADTDDPVDLSGGRGGLTVTRTGTGTYKVDVPATWLGFSIELMQAVGTNYTYTVANSDGDLVITTKDPEAGTAYAAVDLADTESLAITVFITKASL